MLTPVSSPTSLYVMIKPPLRERGLCVAWRDMLRLNPHYGANRFHCTMLHLGAGVDWPRDRLAALIAALDDFRFDPFAVAFDRVVPGPRRSVILKPTHGLRQPGLFHRALHSHLLRAGVAPRGAEKHGFGLHLTLAYRGPHREGAVTKAAIEPFGWLVDEFLLVHSIDGESRHETHGRWRLEPRQLPLPFAA